MARYELPMKSIRLNTRQKRIEFALNGHKYVLIGVKSRINGLRQTVISDPISILTLKLTILSECTFHLEN